MGRSSIYIQHGHLDPSVFRRVSFRRKVVCTIRKRKMKSFTLSVLLLAVVACTLAEDKYTNKYDNFDVDSVLNNDRILSNYIKCLLGEGPCTNEGRELKSK